MVIPHMPVGALVGLLFAAYMFAPPFESARAAITPDILRGELYVLGTAILQTTLLTAQVLGAIGGGLGVHFIGVRRSLAVDAATFVLSGLLIAFGTRARPAAAQPETVQPSPLARMRGGFQLIFGEPGLRTLLLFGWLVVFYTIPEGIAAPYAARLGGGPIAASLVIASTTFGTTIAIPLFTPVRPAASADQPDGPAGRADLRLARLDGPPPESCCLTGDLLVVGCVRRLSDLR